MLSGSAALRVSLLLVAAAVTAGLVQHYLASDTDLPQATVTVEKPTPKPAEPRSKPAEPTAKAAASLQPSAEDPPPPARSPLRNAAIDPPQPRQPPIPEAPAPIPAAPEPPYPSGEASVAVADRNAEPRAVDIVDLNTGTLAQLNGLKGGGSIGRAIIQHRPYGSVDQLLTKRVLSRATYQRIKDQVAAR